MNLSILFDRIARNQKQRQHSRVADYRSLVAQIADGQEPDPAQIDELLASNGKTVDDLKADVDLHIKRLAWRKEYDALPGLAKERKVLEKQIAEADKVLEAADAHHTEVTTPLYYRLGAIKEATRLGNHACDELRRTCNDQELLDELAQVHAEHTKAHNRHMKLQIDSRQMCETAESDRAEAKRQTWPTETARYLEHAETLDERRQELEAQIPDAQQAVENLVRREKEIMDRMLAV